MADKRKPPQYQVYVIALRPDVWEAASMRRRNPDRRLDKPCVYVGYTSKTPAERLDQHLRGDLDAPLVRRFGVGLKPRLFRNVPPSATREEAQAAEAALATRLRRRGYGVWEGRLGALDLRRGHEPEEGTASPSGPESG